METQGKGAVAPQETEPDPPARVGGSCGGVGQQGLAAGTRAPAAAVLEGAPWHESSWRSPSTLPESH